ALGAGFACSPTFLSANDIELRRLKSLRYGRQECLRYVAQAFQPAGSGGFPAAFSKKLLLETAISHTPVGRLNSAIAQKRPFLQYRTLICRVAASNIRLI
ncbi:MAG TPA: hypothetical protein VFB72_13655, partial [Verrucomicrobiae bacterium]|nr:hypothetical protein [Verrucomicrobiae bacterium]